MNQVLHEGVIKAYDSVRDHVKTLGLCLEMVLWLLGLEVGFCPSTERLTLH
jgi:hypothetical protein